jgi:hypothetical protein
MVGTHTGRQAGDMVRAWLSNPHSGAREIAGLAALYGLYEVIRGAGGENVQAALRNTADIVAVEQKLGIYVERSVQGAFEAIPFAPSLLGLAYMVLHFVGTAVALVWVHRRHPDRFPLVRTTFVVATALALVGYVFFPAAPPRVDRTRPQLRPAGRALQPVRGRPEPALRVRPDRRRSARVDRRAPVGARDRRRLPPGDAADHRRDGEPLHRRRGAGRAGRGRGLAGCPGDRDLAGAASAAAHARELPARLRPVYHPRQAGVAQLVRAPVL